MQNRLQKVLRVSKYIRLIALFLRNLSRVFILKGTSHDISDKCFVNYANNSIGLYLNLCQQKQEKGQTSEAEFITVIFLICTGKISHLISISYFRYTSTATMIPA